MRTEHSTSIPNSPAGGLPIQLTTFVGRERECAEVTRLLGSTRLLMLVGTGGVGKTRLALEVARVLGPDYPDGVALAELASLADPALVAQAVAAALGLRDVPGQTATETLKNFLRARRLLLVLDNCEHVLQACAELAESLLRGSEKLQILATSRQPLRVAGETVWRVPSLVIPDPRAASGTDEIAASEAVRLFCERARSVLPGFVLHDHNAAAVAQICRRLDGIPLAIELAAALVRLLGPEQILERLDHRFRLLVGGSRTAPSRQQTLQATLDWSFLQLQVEETILLRRLSVFAGGWTLEAAEAVVAGDGLVEEDVLELLGGLADKSLVVVEGQEVQARYRLLETVRQYALEKLREAAEDGKLFVRHAHWCLALAVRAERELVGAKQLTWLDRLEREQDNLRAALGWARQANAETGLRLAASLGRFWELQGYLAEGRGWLDWLLSVVPERTILRAKALHALGALARTWGDNDRARAAFEESLAIFTELSDSFGRATVLRQLGLTVALQGDYALGRMLMDESVVIGRALGDQSGTGWAIGLRGMLARTEGELDRAQPLLEEALELLRPTEDSEGVAFVLNNLGQLARQKGDYVSAMRLLKESLGLFRAIGAKPRIGWTSIGLGNVARLGGDLDQAKVLLDEGLVLLQEINNQRQLSHGLCFAGILAVQRGRDARGVRLIGAAARYPQTRASLDADELGDWDASLVLARARLGEEEFDQAWSEGQAMTLERSVADALAADRSTPSSQTFARDVRQSDPLSPREREVVVLIARGLSNREIADTLVIAERTAEAHVTHVLSKLRVRSRAQVAVWAVEHGLTGTQPD